ncbi:MAG: Lytic transglycosylase, catalytic [Acidobacteriales bacterium]|nr:Lytic transglycosylase, catalytic [Terriglobales bacterium]
MSRIRWSVFSILGASLLIASSTSSYGVAQTKTKKPSAASAKKSKKKIPVKASAAQKANMRKAAQKKAADDARSRRMKQAFVASSDLKPMARQLLETRSKAAYSGVEHYASKHADSEPGALADLVLGYARLQDNDNNKAIAAFKSAKPHARELSDYVDYMMAQAYRNSGSPKDVIVVLSGFAKQYPDSVFVRDASLMYGNALLSTSAPEQAVEVLENQRKPARADIELALGRAYTAAGQNDKAIDTFRKLYYEMPLSPEADEAGVHLRQMVGTGAYGSREARKTRADLLAKGKRYFQAISEYQQLVSEASGQPVAGIQVALANALYKNDRQSDAKKVLSDITDAKDEINAQRLYLLGEIARSSDDDSTHNLVLDQLRASAPQSGWLQEALLSAANKYLLRRSLDQSAALFAEIATRFPAGRYGPSAHWKAAWLAYRMGKTADAKKQFEEQISLFPNSAEVPNALYWRARIAEDEHETAKARAYYLKLSSRFRNYYYAILARERLPELKKPGTQLDEDPLLGMVPDGQEKVSLIETADGVTDVRLQKAQLLSNGALFDLAIKELQPAVAESDKPWAIGEIVRLHQDAGRPYTALQTLKRAIPNYFAVDLSAVPKPFLETLFPRPYWQDLKRDSVANGLDPYLVASLIRQESEFNAGAVSHANAYGLMQLLPNVGKKVAHDVKLKPFSTARLLEPSANIKLGTRYFRDMISVNGGQVEYALAAYNAGTNRVTDWRAGGSFRDVPEFVESIPFTETREYVQAIMRNVAVYKKVYGAN